MAGGEGMSTDCYNASNVDHTADRLTKLQHLPMESKVIYSLAKIKEYYHAKDGKVFVAYSGGKDSTVLLHLVRSVYPDVEGVYSDTGLEYPEIRDFAITTPNVSVVKPDRSFRQVIQKEGYPIISKECAHYIDLAARGKPSGLNRMERDDRFGFARYAYLVGAPFKISGRCCEILKKRPMRAYQKTTGRYPYIGIRADESVRRKSAYVNHGEISNTGCAPLAIWTGSDIWEYIRTRNLPYCRIYDIPGINSTGCIFCMFGIMSDRERFLRLKRTHPKLWEYCMRPLDAGGLGLKVPLDYMGIPTGCGQTNLDLWTEVCE